ncbi:MAG: carboxypeptidase-like regulatory domain-containing protein [Anaerolineae bacterium]
MGKKKKQIIIVSLIFVLGLPLLVCIALGIFIAPFIISGKPLGIAQDCWGTTIFLRGTVLDAEGQPVENASVRARSVRGNYSASFDIEIITDAEGHFSQSEGIFVFECDQIEYQVQADGFESQTQTFEGHRIPSPELIFILERIP